MLTVDQPQLLATLQRLEIARHERRGVLQMGAVCVFPVLAMKAVGLTRQTGLTAAGRWLQGLAYTAGVLVLFALVAALLLALRAAGVAVGWGYQLQYPPFVALMACLFFVLGLGLSGAVTLGARLTGMGGVGTGPGVVGAFLTGALAALVAAPCTAPFMGVALGYGLSLSWPSALAVMLALGLGLALPYLLLAMFPWLGKKLPKPGAWMENLKQFLAFPLFGTAVWLVWVLSVQTGPDGCPADPQPSQPLSRSADALCITLHGFGIRTKLLTQAYRHGILQVCASRFDHIIELVGFGFQRRL